MHTSNALRTWIVYVGFSPIIMIRAAYSSFGMVCVHVLSARTEDALNLNFEAGLYRLEASTTFLSTTYHSN